MECPNCNYGMYPYNEPLANNAKVCPRCGFTFSVDENEEEQGNDENF